MNIDIDGDIRLESGVDVGADHYFCGLISTEETVVVCENYEWNGSTYTDSGTYFEVFTNSEGCDSSAVLHLIINSPDSSETTESACNSFDWNGETYTASGSYQETFENAAGCDSIATLNLTIHESPDVTVSVEGNELTAMASDNVIAYQWLNCDDGYAPIAGATNEIYVRYPMNSAP